MMFIGTMKITYDQEVYNLNIELTDGVVDETDEDKQGVLLDYDGEGNVVSMEILYASTRMLIPGSVDVAVVGVKL